MTLLALVACLPKEAVSRQEDVEADRYRLEVSIATTTEGPLPVEAFTWRVSGDLLSSWARSFRDGSMGRLVRFEGMQATVERDGVATPVATSLDGAFVELRAFPDGEVLKVEPIAPWAGADAHLELLDLVWPALSPDIPPLKPGQSAPKITSWPTNLPGITSVRDRAETTWTLDGLTAGEGSWSWHGKLAGTPPVRDGTIEGNVVIDTHTPRVVSHALSATRSIETRWPAGKVVQTQQIHVSLRFEGTAPAPHSTLPAHADDPIADAAPLTLSDGRVFPPPPDDLSARLPFVLLPDDLGPDARARAYAQLMEAGRVSPQETVP